VHNEWTHSARCHGLHLKHACYIACSDGEYRPGNLDDQVRNALFNDLLDQLLVLGSPIILSICMHLYESLWSLSVAKLQLAVVLAFI
jgi:hypothetical protein